ncbi:MAG TPA: hypothetical protein DDW52_04850, partial [Planctomycetaceae bacterium]|nr:hypothetical protein [Planctomycetaceae bacterium]
IRDLPLRTAGENAPAVVEFRGEVYMTNSDLADWNVRQIEIGECDRKGVTSTCLNRTCSSRDASV